MAFRTNHSEISIGLGISFNLPEPSVLDEGEYAATIPTSIAEGRDPRDRSLGACMGPVLKVEKVMAQSKNTRAPGGCL